MFALVDANSFYASCETLLRPDLRGKPVVVLSNKDGCVIARNAAAKALGIKMAVPWFQIRTQDFPEKVHVFSSNYALYADMSDRMHRTLESLAPRAEVYPIDECFLDLAGLSALTDFEDYGRHVRARVLATTGLVMGCGIGPSKTLAKSAQWAGKEWPQFGGVLP